MCTIDRDPPKLGSDEEIEIEDWKHAKLNANTLKMIAALREQELFDAALAEALGADEVEK